MEDLSGSWQKFIPISSLVSTVKDDGALVLSVGETDHKMVVYLILVTSQVKKKKSELVTCRYVDVLYIHIYWFYFHDMTHAREGLGASDNNLTA